MLWPRPFYRPMFYSPSPSSSLATWSTDLLNHLRAAFDGDAENARKADTLLTAAKTAPLLLLDDLGAPKPSEWVFEHMHALTDHRLREMLPTLITSNYALGDLDGRIGPPAASRILQMCRPLYLPGPDHRAHRPPTTQRGQG